MRSGSEHISFAPVYLQLFFYHSINLSIAIDMNAFVINNSRFHIFRSVRHLYSFCPPLTAYINAFKRPLGESIIVDNRGKRLVITSLNKGERPSKRSRTNSQLSSSPLLSFQVSISASDAFSSSPS